MADQVNCRECVHFGSAGAYPLWCHAEQFSLHYENNVTSGHCGVFMPRPRALFRCYNCNAAGTVSPEGLCLPCQSVTNVSDEPEEVLYSSMPVAPVAGETSSTAEVAPPEPIHDRIRRVGVEVADLCREKNLAYGSSFQKTGEFLRLLYPDGIRPEQYVDLGLLFRIFDKQMRIATRKDAFGESPFRDIAGYGMMGAANDGQAR
jgi:hypothetical protein